MHRAYQPILPCGNKYLQQKWDQAYYDEHKRKVRSAKPMVDTNSPKTFAHLNTKMKKLQLEEERHSIIERDNRLLLHRMSTIMRTKGSVDNKNDYEAKSLNREKRERELLTISRENESILDRITNCEPQYHIKEWHDDWLKAEQYMDSIARYPRGWYIAHVQKHASKGKNPSTQDPKIINTVEDKEFQGDNDDELRSQSVEEKGKKQREKNGKEKIVRKKQGKAKITKAAQAKEHEQESEDGDVAAGTADKAENENVIDNAVDNENPTDEGAQDENLADDRAENKYLKDEHEEYTDDDKSEQETRSEIEEDDKEESHEDIE
ncbi:uncharacterized protein CFAP97D2 [Pelobates fuscus]|uniref:uncharacterized protein CFAP97D2 n=1 Tax=Pelobates fuscus TaxID=191477 RepID=UPI002FE45B73